MLWLLYEEPTQKKTIEIKFEHKRCSMSYYTETMENQLTFLIEFRHNTELAAFMTSIINREEAGRSRPNNIGVVWRTIVSIID